jgi:hypothetical protein
MLWAQAIDDAQKKLEEAANDPAMWKYIGLGLAAVAILYLLVKFLGGKKAIPDVQAGLKENLKDYPAPPGAGQRTLDFNGLSTRIRLIVMAPSGKQKETLTAEQIPALMGDLLRGLQTVIKTDKPRMKVWPTQLSVDGFAPTFHRLVSSPDADNTKSHWVRLAGPVKIGGKPYLLAMALYSEETTKIGKVIMDANQWAGDLKIES